MDDHMFVRKQNVYMESWRNQMESIRKSEETYQVHKVQ
jgi:hypothetical protein